MKKASIISYCLVGMFYIFMLIMSELDMVGLIKLSSSLIIMFLMLGLCFTKQDNNTL